MEWDEERRLMNHEEIAKLSDICSVTLIWYTMNLRQSTGNVIFEIYLSVVCHELSIFIPAHITLYRLCKNNIKFKDLYNYVLKVRLDGSRILQALLR